MGRGLKLTITLLALLVLTSCNKTFLRDYWEEVTVKVPLKELPTLTNHSISDNNKVDIVVAVDNSLSMTPEHELLRDNFQTFVNNLSSSLDIKLSLVTSDGIIKNTNHTCPRAGRPIEIASGTCFSHNINGSNLINMIDYLDPRKSQYMGDKGCYFEAPVFYGLYTFIENPGNCHRNANTHKILFVLSDEDERVDGDDVSIDETAQQAYIGVAKKHGIKAYSITHGTDRPLTNDKKGTHAPAIVSIVSALGGEDYDIEGNYGNHMVKFAEEINRFGSQYSFTKRPADKLDDATVMVKTPNGTFNELPSNSYTLTSTGGNNFSVNITNTSILEGKNAMKVVFPELKPEDFVVKITAERLTEDKLVVLINGKVLDSKNYTLDPEANTITIPKEYKLSEGAAITVKYVDLKNKYE